MQRECSVQKLACKFLSFFSGVTGELSTLRQIMKVPNEPGLSPNNGLENVFLSDQSMASSPRKEQANVLAPRRRAMKARPVMS